MTGYDRANRKSRTTTCTAAWNVEHWCYGWTKHGHQFHGCAKHDGHDDKRHGDNVHLCKCGATTTEPLPPPVGPSMRGKDWR